MGEVPILRQQSFSQIKSEIMAWYTLLSKNTKSLISWLLYIGLVVIGLTFVWRVLCEYTEGKTSFHVRTEHLYPQDQPTLTICFEYRKQLKYNTDFSIGITYNDSLFTPLSEGKNDFEDMNGTRYQLHMAPLSVFDDKKWLHRHCFKISPQDSENFSSGTYNIIFSNSTKPPSEAILYFTTEENSYGVIFNHWFDGEVHPYVLKKGWFHDIGIPIITSYTFNLTKCSAESYYQCLSSKFTMKNSCEGDLCSRYSLPSAKPLENLPPCNDSRSFNCQGKALLKLFNDENGPCRGSSLKLCHTQEYLAEEYTASYKVKDLPGFMFEFAFTLPESSHGHRPLSPFKTIHEEHYVWNEVKLIGTVGGALGLMIGFSFERMISWFINNVFGICTVVSKLNNKLNSDYTSDNSIEFNA